jgi:pSer/pThr/pTyr-binding forkhead associated (FHA) protein
MPSLKAILLPKRQHEALDRSVTLEPRGSWIIGSNKQTSDIFVDSDIVSDRHAELVREVENGADAWYLVCAGSENGTFLNGRRISQVPFCHVTL